MISYFIVDTINRLEGHNRVTKNSRHPTEFKNQMKINEVGGTLPNGGLSGSIGPQRAQDACGVDQRPQEQSLLQTEDEAIAKE